MNQNQPWLSVRFRDALTHLQKNNIIRLIYWLYPLSLCTHVWRKKWPCCPERLLCTEGPAGVWLIDDKFANHFRSRPLSCGQATVPRESTAARWTRTPQLGPAPSGISFIQVIFIILVPKAKQKNSKLLLFWLSRCLHATNGLYGKKVQDVGKSDMWSTDVVPTTTKQIIVFKNQPLKRYVGKNNLKQMFLSNSLNDWNHFMTFISSGSLEPSHSLWYLDINFHVLALC